MFNFKPVQKIKITEFRHLEQIKTEVEKGRTKTDGGERETFPCVEI